MNGSQGALCGSICTAQRNAPSVVLASAGDSLKPPPGSCDTTETASPPLQILRVEGEAEAAAESPFAMRRLLRLPVLGHSSARNTSPHLQVLPDCSKCLQVKRTVAVCFIPSIAERVQIACSHVFCLFHVVAFRQLHLSQSLLLLPLTRGGTESRFVLPLCASSHCAHSPCVVIALSEVESVSNNKRAAVLSCNVRIAEVSTTSESTAVLPSFPAAPGCCFCSPLHAFARRAMRLHLSPRNRLIGPSHLVLLLLCSVLSSLQLWCRVALPTVPRCSLRPALNGSADGRAMRALSRALPR